MSKDNFKEEEIKGLQEENKEYRGYTKEELKELEKDFKSVRRDMQFMNFLLKVEEGITNFITKVTNAVSSIFSCKKK